MAKNIDWLYFRKGCATCKKAQGYIEPIGTKVKETVDATKIRIGNDEALAMLADVNKIVAAKGKKIEIFDLKKERPDDETLLSHLIGPTGNLRAPTARIGKTLLVGFNPEAYGDVLGVVSDS